MSQEYTPVAFDEKSLVRCRKKRAKKSFFAAIDRVFRELPL